MENFFQCHTTVRGRGGAYAHHYSITIHVSYTKIMSNDVDFKLDKRGGQDILVNMAAPVIKSAANSIQSRAASMASSISSRPPEISVSEVTEASKNGKGGSRAVAYVNAVAADPHQRFVGYTALAKSQDAGHI